MAIINIIICDNIYIYILLTIFCKSIFVFSSDSDVFLKLKIRLWSLFLLIYAPLVNIPAPLIISEPIFIERASELLSLKLNLFVSVSFVLYVDLLIYFFLINLPLINACAFISFSIEDGLLLIFDSLFYSNILY